MIRLIFHFIFWLRNGFQKLAARGIEKLRDPQTGKLTFVSPDNIKPTVKVLFTLFFLAVLVYALFYLDPNI